MQTIFKQKTLSLFSLYICECVCVCVCPYLSLFLFLTVSVRHRICVCEGMSEHLLVPVYTYLSMYVCTHSFHLSLRLSVFTYLSPPLSLYPTHPQAYIKIGEGLRNGWDIGGGTVIINFMWMGNSAVRLMTAMTLNWVKSNCLRAYICFCLPTYPCRTCLQISCVIFRHASLQQEQCNDST